MCINISKNKSPKPDTKNYRLKNYLNATVNLLSLLSCYNLGKCETELLSLFGEFSFFFHLWAYPSFRANFSVGEKQQPYPAMLYICLVLLRSSYKLCFCSLTFADNVGSLSWIEIFAFHCIKQECSFITESAHFITWKWSSFVSISNCLTISYITRFWNARGMKD